MKQMNTAKVCALGHPLKQFCYQKSCCMRQQHSKESLCLPCGKCEQACGFSIDQTCDVGTACRCATFRLPHQAGTLHDGVRRVQESAAKGHRHWVQKSPQVLAILMGTHSRSVCAPLPHMLFLSASTWGTIVAILGEQAYTCYTKI